MAIRQYFSFDFLLSRYNFFLHLLNCLVFLYQLVVKIFELDFQIFFIPFMFVNFTGQSFGLFVVVVSDFPTKVDTDE